MKKILVTLCVVLLLITGCGKAPQLKNGEEAVISLKNSNISVDDLYNKLKEKYAVSVLIDMIDTEILNKKYETDEEEKQDIENKISQMKAQYENDEAQFLSAIQQYFGVQNEAELREVLSLDYKRGLAIDEYVKGTITDKEINEYYENKAIGDQKASHILIKPVTNDSMTEEEKEEAEKEALKKAKEIISKLNNGEDFAKLAKENSEDTGSAEDGGNVGFFNRNSNMDEEFLEATIALKKGEYTKEPVKSSYGYHIILKTDEKEKSKLKTIKDDIIDTLKDEKLEKDSKLQYKALIELRKSNKIEIHDDTLKSQYDIMMNQLLTAEDSEQ